MDLSSELVHCLLPVFLVTHLGASALTVGFLEGIAEATALIVKVFSGALSDYLGFRKWLIFAGYGMAALTKPLFPLAHSIEVVFVARFLDRIGKGIRGAPRDALIAEVAPLSIRNACYGLRQSMDAIGAFLGPLAAVALLFYHQDDIKAVLWYAVIPAFLSVFLIFVGIQEPKQSKAGVKFKSPIQWIAAKEFSNTYWWIVALGAVFSLARFSEAFLLLQAHQVGLSITSIPIVMVIMSLVYSLSAYPVGMLADRIDRKRILSWGLIALILADLTLASSNNSLELLIMGVVFWGLHMGLSQGIITALIADAAPTESKGTAFGIFNSICGLSLLFASIVAGLLWDAYGSQITFFTGAIFSAVAYWVLIFIRATKRIS